MFPDRTRFPVLAWPCLLSCVLALCAAAGARAQEQSTSRNGNDYTLSVRLVSTDGPIAGAQVRWGFQPSQPGDTTLSPPVTQTDGNGVASFSVRLAPAPGTRTVTWADDNDGFGSFTLSHDAGLAQDALGQHAALPGIGLESARNQLRTIAQRLRQRRGGGGAVSIFGNGLAGGRALDPITARMANRNAPSADPGGRLGVFLNGQGSRGTRDTTANERGFDADTAGLTGGTDYRLRDDLLVGAALGVLSTRAAFAANLGDTRTQGLSASAFGTYYINNFYVDSILTYGSNWYDSERNVGAGLTANGSTRGAQYGGSVSSGWTGYRGALSAGPYARLTYLRATVDGFTETGASGANLSVARQEATSLTTALGAQVAYALSTAWGVLSPQARLEWEHEHRQGVRLITGSLTADPVKSTFALPSDTPDRDYFNLGLGVAAQFAQGRSLFLSYEGQFGRSDFRNHVLLIGGRIEF